MMKKSNVKNITILILLFFAIILSLWPTKIERPRVKDFIHDRINSLSMSEESKSFSQALLLGDKESIKPAHKKMWRNAGMSHIMAVSGLHIGIILVVLFYLLWPLRWLHLHILHRMLVLFFIWLYVWQIGLPPSAVRAAIMASFVLLSWVFEREPVAWHNLIAAFIIIVAIDTVQVQKIGFQLSFFAAFGIISVKPLLNKQNRFWQLFTIACAAQIINMPLIAYYFHQIPVFGWIQGFIVVPLLPILLYCLILYLIFPELAVLRYPIDALVNWTNFVADNISRLEVYILGGRVSFYPSLMETCLYMILLSAIYILIYKYEKNETTGQKFKIG